MSKKKGLSVEEKRTKMMELFYEKKDVFQLKELEKICPKEKGITSMSVKEILQGLVDDGMVDSDKIGTSIYFWAFPSKASQNRTLKIDELEKKEEELMKKKKSLEEAVEEAKQGRERSEQRVVLLKRLEEKKKEKEELVKELERHRDCDPVVLEGLKRETEVAKEAANRWTVVMIMIHSGDDDDDTSDNIFNFKSWLKKKFNCEESTINKQFEIPDDMDYIE